MTDQAALASKLETSVSQLRCIACGAVRAGDATNVRCAQCGDLLEVVYPGWKTSAGMRAAGLDAAGLKELWRQRRTSYNPLDAERRVALSRSASCFERLESCHHFARGQHAGVRTARLRPRGRSSAALRQASRHESHRLFQGHRYDVGCVLCPRGRLPLGGVRVDRQHFRLHGGLRGSRWNAQPGADSARPDHLGKTFAGARTTVPSPAS